VLPLTTLSGGADFAADSVESSHILGVSASLRVSIAMRQCDDDRWLNWQTEHKSAIKQPETLAAIALFHCINKSGGLSFKVCAQKLMNNIFGLIHGRTLTYAFHFP